MKPIRESLAANNMLFLNMVRSLSHPNCPHMATLYEHTFICIFETHIRIRHFARPYPIHPHVRTHVFVKLHTWTTERCTKTHSHKTWHGLPWLQTPWMNHWEICPFCPKLLASKSYSALKSRERNQWIMLLLCLWDSSYKEQWYYTTNTLKKCFFFLQMTNVLCRVTSFSRGRIWTQMC